MHHIVSIDFDIIMAPSIQLYNNMVGPDKWEQEFMDIPQLALSQADLQHYQILIQWLLTVVPQMKPGDIHFILDHEKILNFLPEDNDIIITNIDHHHDIAYEPPHFYDKVTDSNLTCGNWVKYIADNKNLVRYHWVNNANSTFVPDECSGLLTSATDFRDFNFNALAVPQTLVICLSPLWVPPTYRPLFYGLMDICNFIHKRHYNVEA